MRDYLSIHIYQPIHLTGDEYSTPGSPEQQCYIEATVFGIPLLRVEERYLDGRGRIELPFGADEGPKIDL